MHMLAWGVNLVGKRQSFSQTTFKINTSANINYDSKEKITHDFFAT